MNFKYIIGIDLGTTNSVLAYAKVPPSQESVSEDTVQGNVPVVEILPIPQYVAAGTVELRKSLPSFLYLPTDQEASQYEDALPWGRDQAGGLADNDRTIVLGEAARRRSSEVPDRSISAAKSWLCHSKVDRRAPILPWGADDSVGKLSPLEVSRAILRHLIDAWESAFPDAPIAWQQVVLTVPASFDASARELTREAAVAAGLPKERLLFLEEPQAALYSWLCETGDRWRKMLHVGDKLLVCDVGGGTTDLTLIAVEEEQGELTLKRLAVGDHLLVGGDNMDLALAHLVAELLADSHSLPGGPGGTKLDPWQSVALWHSAREAKEILLAEKAKASHKISILGRGSKLIGGTVSVDVPRDRVVTLLTDGFFPKVALSDRPKRRAMSGFREIGLPFEQDSAMTRHLAAFLSAQGENGTVARPTHVLLNGGVFRATTLEKRLFDVLADWFPDAVPQRLCPTFELDHAVARGAAFYGLSKNTGGIRIRGGTARAYYVGIETSGLAIPGAPRPLKALCVAPIGMEEGTECDVPSDEFALITGEPVPFRFFSSTTRRNDKPGTLLDASHISAQNAGEESDLAETDSMEALLPRENSDDEEVPVRFQTRVTELGILELWSLATNSDKRWKLEFSVREET
ncbi:MAG: Hsp70 family protein [Planctomycetaceae bacterium]|nr:Hsp70 family protein [Planctomycetaceae bacterium]